MIKRWSVSPAASGCGKGVQGTGPEVIGTSRESVMKTPTPAHPFVLAFFAPNQILRPTAGDAMADATMQDQPKIWLPRPTQAARAGRTASPPKLIFALCIIWSLFQLYIASKAAGRSWRRRPGSEYFCEYRGAGPLCAPCLCAEPCDAGLPHVWGTRSKIPDLRLDPCWRWASPPVCIWLSSGLRSPTARACGPSTDIMACPGIGMSRADDRRSIARLACPW